jgi:hypothetical protein
MTKGNREMENTVWESSVTEEMISHLTSNEVSMLVEELNTVVMEVCQNYEVKG